MFGAVWAQAELRKVLGAMGGRVIEAELPVGHAKELLVDGRLELSPEQSEHLEEILAELIRAAEVEAELGGRGLRNQSLNRRHSVDCLIERGNRLDVGELGGGNQIRLGKVETIELIDLKGAKEELRVSGNRRHRQRRSHQLGGAGSVDFVGRLKHIHALCQDNIGKNQLGLCGQEPRCPPCHLRWVACQVADYDVRIEQDGQVWSFNLLPRARHASWRISSHEAPRFPGGTGTDPARSRKF